MYKSIDEIRSANQAQGGHFFDNEWFSKVADPTVYAGQYFITEDFLNIGKIKVEPKYSIRRADPDGGISTVGIYASYETLQSAINAVKGLQE